MKTISRITALALCAGMILPAAAATACGKKKAKSTAAEIPAPQLTGTFTYLSSEDMTAEYFYCDDYFASPGTEQNEHLRTMSFDVALAAFGSSGDDASENVIDLLADIGFDTENAAVDQYDIEPTRDSIASVITHKKTASGNVIAVAVRGGNYKSEWANNFLVGESGDAQGFSGSAEVIVARIKAYEEEHGLSGAKIWMTGYSRGGGVSDLAGKYINERLDEFGITADDIYIYTFEAPRASSTDPELANIHNVYSQNDLVPKVYPETWGFYNAGVDEPIECENASVELSSFDILGGIGIGKKPSAETEETEPETESMEDFENELLELLTGSISRDDFNNVSVALGDLAEILMTRTPEQSEAFSEFFGSAFTLDDTSLLTAIAPMAMYDSGTDKFKNAAENAADVLVGKLDDADHSECLTDDEYEKLRTALPQVLVIFAPAIKVDISSDEPLKIFSTFSNSLVDILMWHSPDGLLALTEAMDSNYSSAE